MKEIQEGWQGCHDYEATPQLDTVTLRPAPSDTVTIRPMSYLWHDFSYTIRLRIFGLGCFHRGLIVTVMIRPAQAILIVTIRLAWRWDTTAACKFVRMRWPNLTRCMVDLTQQDTIDRCLGGALLGGSRHISGEVRSGLRPADPCMGEVLLGGAAEFFNSAICVSWSELSPPPLAWRSREWVGLSVGRIVTANV
jgi:hypothetical protein